jgi:hypothetical protein
MSMRCRISLALPAVLIWGFLACQSCAVHYFDPATGTEHIWGIGHLAVKHGSPTEGVKAVGRRTDTVGVLIGQLDKEAHFGVGWNARQEIEVVDENVQLKLDWPSGSFYDIRVGSWVPPNSDHSKEDLSEEGGQ